MKTIKEWFESFPDPDIRARLLANLEQEPANGNRCVGSFRQALGGGFQWPTSIEGRNDSHYGNEFWETIYESIDGDLPATAAEYCADLRDRNAKLQESHSDARTLLLGISRNFKWLTNLSETEAQFFDEAQIRRTLQRVEDFLHHHQ